MRQVLAEQAVRVFVRAALPRSVGVAEVDLDIRGDREGRDGRRARCRDPRSAISSARRAGGGHSAPAPRRPWRFLCWATGSGRRSATGVRPASRRRSTPRPSASRLPNGPARRGRRPPPAVRGSTPRRESDCAAGRRRRGAPAESGAGAADAGAAPASARRDFAQTGCDRSFRATPACQDRSERCRQASPRSAAATTAAPVWPPRRGVTRGRARQPAAFGTLRAPATPVDPPARRDRARARHSAPLRGSRSTARVGGWRLMARNDCPWASRREISSRSWLLRRQRERRRADRARSRPRPPTTL